MRHSSNFLKKLFSISLRNVTIPWIFWVEFDPLVSLVVCYLLGFGLKVVCSARVTTAFLFSRQQLVDVVGEKTRTTLGLGEVPHFVNGDQFVPRFTVFSISGVRCVKR